MRGVLDILKILYYRNKLVFVVALAAIALFVVGCTAQGAPPPQGPIGGGCGG